MALADTGVYAWVRDSLHVDLGDGKIANGATWTLHLIESGAYNPDFVAHEAFSVISGASIVDSAAVVPGAFSGGVCAFPNVTFPLLSGPDIGGVALTVSGSIERLYAHWGKENAGTIFFETDGGNLVLTGLKLQHETVIV